MNNGHDDEHAWLIAREADPDAPPPSAKVAAEYAHLEAMLGGLSVDGDDDDNWRAEVLRQARALGTRRAPWWRRPAARWALAGGGVAAVAVLALVLLRPQPAAAELAFRTEHVGVPRANPHEIVVGDRLVAALPRGGHDLRLYRPDGQLVAYCPGGPGCADGAQLEVSLHAVGRYYLYLVTDNVQLSFEGTMGDFVDRIHTANVQPQMKSFDVH